MTNGDVEASAALNGALVVSDAVELDNNGVGVLEVAGRADHAALERLRVEIRQTNAASIARQSAIHRLAEHLDRFHLLLHLQRRYFHILRIYIKQNENSEK